MSEDTAEEHPTDEERALFSTYSEEFISKIDAAIFFETREGYFLKCARIVARAQSQFKDVPVTFFAERIIAMTEQGILTGAGNLRRWRFSEVMRAPKRQQQ